MSTNQIRHYPPTTNFPEPPSLSGDWVLVADKGDGSTEWKKATNLVFGVFAPTFIAREDGGDFSGLSTVEKGYVIPKVALVWTSNDPATYPITDSDTLTMDGGAIDLDGVPPGGGTGGSTNGGTYSDPGGLTELEEGSGFGVQLYNNADTVMRYAGMTWRWSFHWLISSVATPDASWLADVLDGTIPSGKELRSSRACSKSFNPSNEYIYFVINRTLGAAQFLYAGLPTTFIKTQLDGVANKYGASSNWDVYRSNQLLTGSGIVIEVV